MSRVNVLIVEDNKTKRVEIEKALPPGIDFDVNSTPSIAQAYRALANKPWDIVILDMTFHVAQSAGQESAKEALAGVEMLQFITQRRIAVPVVVATQHRVFSTPEMPGIDSIEKLDQLLQSLFPENYRGIVEVDLAEEGWKRDLQDAIRRALGPVR
jgi:CheY-like chemotaxis protein